MKLHYYTSWTNPQLVVKNPGEHGVLVRMTRGGKGRTKKEFIYTAEFELPGSCGFYIFDHHDCDPLNGEDLYHPTLSECWLRDGEFFSRKPPREDPSPHYETHLVHSDELNHDFVVHAMLPRDFSRRSKPYPVAFLHDGQNQWKGQGFFGGWHTDEATLDLSAAGRLEDIVLITIEAPGDRRDDTYLPKPIGAAEKYIDFIADIIYPKFAKKYNLTADPNRTAVVGSSFGGNCAVFAGLHRPDRFRLIGSMSFAELPGTPIIKRLKRTGKLPFEKIYLDTGTMWSHDQEGEENDFTPSTELLIDLMQQKRYVQHRNMWGRICEGHAHWEPDWRQRIPDCLSFLFAE